MHQPFRFVSIHPMRKKRAARFLCILFCVLCLAACKTSKSPTTQGQGATPSPATPEKTVYAVKDGTTMYDGPGAAYNVIDTCMRGDAGVFISEEGEWTKVQMQENTGYIQTENLSETQVWPNMPEVFNNPRIVVYKSSRELMLYDGERCYGRYAIGLGWMPVGDKEGEGDGKTPEGIYYVCCRNQGSRFYLSLGVSYPNGEDAARGLAQGLIDESTYQRICQTVENGGQPPWDTPMGGEIMIHGGGSHSDWTAGCIAVENEVMDILWSLCPVGTKIEIFP